MRSMIGFGRRLGHLVDDAAVTEEDHAVGVRRRVGVVGDHDDRLAVLADRPAEEVEDLGTGPGVEVSRRLVGEDDVGLGGHRPGHRDALLLAARQLARPVLEAVLEARPS